MRQQKGHIDVSPKLHKKGLITKGNRSITLGIQMPIPNQFLHGENSARASKSARGPTNEQYPDSAASRLAMIKERLPGGGDS